jgi:hypothetical protein
MSHGRAAAAMRNGVFDDEIVAVLAPIERRLVEYSVRPSEGILCGSDLLTPPGVRSLGDEALTTVLA